MLRYKSLIFAVAISVMASGSPAHAQSMSEMLEKGIFTEETVGDLDAAIKIYESIAARAEQNRPFAAQAQYRLGMCYLKKGQKQEAGIAFRKLIELFPKQTQPVVQAKAQLSALGHPVAAMVTRQVWAPALDMMGTPSPDGRYLSYVNWTKGNLAVHDFKTGENRDLTDEGTWESPNQFCDVSIWSPDSQQIAYYWIDRGGGTGLRIVGLDGSKPRVLSGSDLELGPGVPAAPWPRAWSQDGKYILALQGKKDKSQAGHEDHIVLVSVADGSVRVLKSLGEEHSERHGKKMSLSPDGRYVVYDLGGKQGSKKRDIYLLATDGSGDVPIVEHPADDWAPYWTPDGKQMVFLSDRSGSTGLWMLDVEDGTPTGTPTQIKETGSMFYPMGFTRDGSFYYGIGNAESDVYVATIDFGAGKVLTSPIKTSLRYEGTNHAPIWSPDGKFLAYASQRSGRQSYLLVIRTVETGEERDLSPATLAMAAAHAWGAPQWSPDGRSILVAGRTEGARSPNYGLHLVDVQTGNLTTILQDERGTNEWESGPRWPVFSKDGKHVYYMRDRSIMALSLETRRESELYRANNYIARLACSPDGQRLAFFEQSQAEQPAVLKTIRASGGDPHDLFTLRKGQRVFWSVGISWTPDGRHVVIAAPDAPDKTNDLWIIPAAGGEPRILNLGGNAMQLSLHPDGRRIAFSRREPGGSREVWVMENFLPEVTDAP